MSRLDKERELQLQPKRMEFAIKELTKIGKVITYRDETKIQFEHERSKITFFPYSGWHTGATISDGRGLKKLLRQLK